MTRKTETVDAETVEPVEEAGPVLVLFRGVVLSPIAAPGDVVSLEVTPQVQYYVNAGALAPVLD